jgi:DNA-binding transcriptional MerR regulator
MYRRRDVELILEIKHLIYEKKFTIQGAKQHLKKGFDATPSTSLPTLEDIRKELKQIRDLLS